ncbi:Stk1 family PASTA domain-containing Ser/Thr kinase [Brachybacterium sp. UMB0905]|uniref:Stk1 family PASTA domain-containing Ser/Thr kinase n=1 Tax=Brachybacterium sp. UMB0905 TaxID=2069310 RepID=UPI000C7FC9C9|nr:Stk1 family PASTA domain-containing Ser/Thr kinase [Brachybacterium sp. UMB0905]PMC76924.1 serine/threonine protein kinase [Brachybacterium sp. UMB0905]
MNENSVLLGGRYRLGEVLGSGGMAEVFLAEDTRLHRTVAVKVLRSDLAQDANFQERFRREAHSAASLNHPAIVAVYDTGEEQQRTVTGSELTIPFIVMEYVQGHTLRELIDPEQPMDARRAGEIMGPLLSALEYSHRAGIVHRDIKPGNIMINQAGAVKVMDFGIARAIADATSAMTATQAVMGTAQYLSPEQARGQLVDARSDIYSAACVMYEMLTGRPPFTGDTPVSIAYQHVREEPQAPSMFNPAITPEMDAVILTGLAKDREARYPSAEAFGADIRTVLAGGTPELTAAAAAAGEDPEATTVLSTVDDATEALPMVAAGVGAAGTGAAGADSASSPSPATGPLALRSEEELEPEKKPWWLFVLIVLAVLGLIAAALAVLQPWKPDGPQMVTVPDVVGLSEEEAGTALTEQGLEPSFEQVASTEVETGQVISTDPPAGEEVESGSAVAVTVSAGPDAVTVPEDLEGKTREEARKALEKVGLVMVEGETEDVPQEQGTVASTNPQGGASVDQGSEVTVRFASGDVQVPDVVGIPFEQAKEQLEARGFQVPDPSARESEDADPNTVLSQTPGADAGTARFGSRVDLVVAAEPGPVAVPNVTGQSLEDARQALRDAGFTGSEVVQEHSDSVPEGHVIRTDPPANEETDRGTTITIVVSSGPEPTPEPTEDPTEEPDPEDPTDEPTEEDPSGGNGNNAGGNAPGENNGRGNRGNGGNG